MADQGKTGKKGKSKQKQVLDLSQFNQMIDEPLDWDKEVEKNLPTVPMSMQDVEQVYNFNDFPHSAPFILVLENAPFGVERKVYTDYLKGLRYKDIDLDAKFGRQTLPTVEFDTRGDMLECVRARFTQEINNRAIKFKSLAQMQHGYGNDRRNDDRQQRNRDYERAASPEGPWRRGPSDIPDRPPQQDFQRMDRRDNRESEVRIERNFNNRYEDNPRPAFDNRREPAFDRPPMRRNDDAFPDRNAKEYQSSYGDLPPPGYDPRPSRSRNEPFQRRDDRGGFNDRRTTSRESQGSYNRNRSRQEDTLDSQNWRANMAPVQAPPPPREVRPPPRPIPERAPPQERAPAPEPEAPKERPRLVLQPRTKPLEPEQGTVAGSSVFGGAKPVDTAAKEREVEERLRKQREEEQKRIAEERERMTGQKAPQEPHNNEGQGHPERQSYQRTDSLTDKVQQIRILERDPNSKPRDSRPVASVPPIRKDPVPYQQNRAQEPPKLQEPDRTLPVSNRFAAAGVLEDDSEEVTPKAKEPVQREMSNQSSEDFNRDPDHQLKGEESDASNSGFQVVQNTRKRAPAAAQQQTRIFSRGGRNGAPRRYDNNDGPRRFDNNDGPRRYDNEAARNSGGYRGEQGGRGGYRSRNE